MSKIKLKLLNLNNLNKNRKKNIRDDRFVVKTLVNFEISNDRCNCIYIKIFCDNIVVMKDSIEHLMKCPSNDISSVKDKR